MPPWRARVTRRRQFSKKARGAADALVRQGRGVEPRPALLPHAIARLRRVGGRGVRPSYPLRTLIPPPEVRSTSFGPPPLILPRSESSSCDPCTVTGTSE